MPPRVILDQRPYKGWEAWSIQRGPLELIMVPQIGGRIMGALWRNYDVFFTQPEREGQVPDLEPDGNVLEQKRAVGFPLWGGDKTWLAPQGRWNQASPFLDLDSGPYELRVACAGPDLVELSMTSRVCRETGIRLCRVITVRAEQPAWTVRHEVENAGRAPVQWGLWDVTMVRRPADVFLPCRSTSAYPDGVKTYVEEGHSATLRASVVESFRGIAHVRCRESGAFKFGVDADEGWILAAVVRGDGALVGYRKRVPAFADREYAHGCVAEVYNSDSYSYFELELHGPLVTLQPGETFVIEERHELFDLDSIPRSEDQVRALNIGT